MQRKDKTSIRYAVKQMQSNPYIGPEGYRRFRLPDFKTFDKGRW